MSTHTKHPNISRIYDYVLGGYNNFEAHHLAAEQIMQVLPTYPRWAKLNRWFLQLIGEQWAQQRQPRILDLESGLPTQSHLHTILPDAKILYTDNDPIAVVYAREFLQGTPNVMFEQADMCDADHVVALAEQTFGADRQVAIGCIGISYFLDDTHLRGLMQALHDWAAPGSVMAVSALYGEIVSEDSQRATELFKRNNAEIFPRDEAIIRSLCEPWEIIALKPLSEWLDVEYLMQESDYQYNTEFYGILLEHVAV